MLEMERHGEWMSRQASWMARRFRTEYQEAYQLLSLAICHGMNRKHARLRTIRTLLRESGRVAHQGSQIERSITAEPSDLLTMAREILDQVEWQLIELHLIQELSLRDAARKIGIGRETARASYHAALVKLKTKLETQDNGKKVSRG